MPAKNPENRTALALSPTTRLILDDHAPVGHDGRNRSPSMAADIAIQSYYAWVDTAWEQIKDRFSALHLFWVAAALQGTYVEPSLISCLSDELLEYFQALHEEPGEGGAADDPERESQPTEEQMRFCRRVAELSDVQRHALVWAARRQYANRRTAIVDAKRDSAAPCAAATGA